MTHDCAGSAGAGKPGMESDIMEGSMQNTKKISKLKDDGKWAWFMLAPNIIGFFLFMLVPVIVTVIVAVNTGDIIIATTIGIVLAGLTGAVTGQFDFLQIDLAENVNALFSV